MSLVGALTHLGKVAHTYWLRSVIAYTVTGSLSALLVGSLLGWMGRWLGAADVCWLVVPLALALAAREQGFVRFQLPERKRQTEKNWAHEFGFTAASAMWGFHIGLGFTTYVRYGGFWVLAFMAFGVGEPGYGALLMLLYWLGRAGPVWVMPLIWRGRDTGRLMDAVSASRYVYSRCETFCLLWSAGVAIIWVLQNRTAQPSNFILGHIRWGS